MDSFTALLKGFQNMAVFFKIVEHCFFLAYHSLLICLNYGIFKVRSQPLSLIKSETLLIHEVVFNSCTPFKNSLKVI